MSRVDQTMTVIVNGEERQTARDMTVLGLLKTLDLDPRAVVVELNREIVRRPALADTWLCEGDQIELVHFVGGG